MAVEKEMVEMVIGALLHDIGKISERAQMPLSAQSEGIKPQICPIQSDKSYGYRHVVHTNEFFETVKSWLPRELDPGKIANIASYHHSPSSPLHVIVQQADWLSAGQDRQEDESVSGKRDFCTSIFQSLIKDKANSQEYILPLVPLVLNEKIFPCSSKQTTSPISDYQSLWRAALEHYKQLEPSAPSVFLEQLLWIHTLYTWSVPSHRAKHFEISLLDHSLTTAAFSGALYQYHHTTDSMDEKAIKDWKTKKFRIVSGDLSGIQSYLYHTTLDRPSGVSKRLRSKSFYLSFLTRLAGNLILDNLGLTCLNRIIDAGGNFTLLVHNTPASIASIKQSEKQIQQWFHETFRGKLTLNLSCDTELSGEDFTQNRFHVIQENLAWKMDLAKKTPNKNLMIESGNWIEDTFILPDELNETMDGSKDSFEDLFFNDLGTKLTQGKFLLVSSKPLEEPVTPKASESPLAVPFGRYHFTIANTPAVTPDMCSCIQFVPGTDRQSLSNIRCGSFLANYVPRQTDADRAVYQDPVICQWLAGQLKEDNEDVYSPNRRKSFAHLCADAIVFDRNHKPKGMPLMAVLKADVDRLGMLFSKGLQETRASLSYYISLSRQLDLFFRGILPNLFLEPPAEHPDYRNIYTVYTGGDDLLLVGPWRTILSFAGYMQKLFGRYVCQHPQITLSAGISICHSRFPLSQAAEQADQALSKAKQNRNRVCVFDTVLEWSELEKALHDALFLDQIMAEGGADGIEVTKGFIYRLIHYCQMDQNRGKLKNLLWRSHLRYDMARNVKDIEKNHGSKPPGRERLEKMTALTKDSNEMSRLKVAVTYCLYMNR